MALHHLAPRLASSAALLAVAMTTVLGAAQLGAVHLGAGDMKIVFGRGDAGLIMDVARRTCPPHCGFDINWTPLRG